MTGNPQAHTQPAPCYPPTTLHCTCESLAVLLYCLSRLARLDSSIARQAPLVSSLQTLQQRCHVGGSWQPHQLCQLLRPPLLLLAGSWGHGGAREEGAGCRHRGRCCSSALLLPCRRTAAAAPLLLLQFQGR